MPRPSKAEIEARQAEREARFNTEVAEKVSATIAAMMPGLVAQITQQVGDARAVGPSAPLPEGARNLSQPHTPEGDHAFAQSLALAIADIASQGTGRAPFIPPERIKKWNESRTLMLELLAKYRGLGGEHTPKYRVTETCFLNETRIFPQWHDKPNNRMQDTYIWWDEAPNLGMEPANESAEAVFAAYLGSIAELPSKRPAVDAPFVQTATGDRTARLFRGMSKEQRETMFPGKPTDPRVEGHGAPVGQGRHSQVLGNVAPPAVMR